MQSIVLKKAIRAVLLVVVAILAFSGVAHAQDSQTAFEVTQRSRNLTKQNFTWMEVVPADPGDRLEFQVQVVWRGSQAADEVFMRETLSQGLTYAANPKLNGSVVSGNPTTENFSLGTFGTNESKTLTFEVLVNASSTFPAGTSNLVNTATVFSVQGAASGISRVEVARDGKPTDVSTGPISFWMIGLVLLMIAASAGAAFLYLRSYLQREVFESAYDNRSERKLATMITSIKKKERKS